MEESMLKTNTYTCTGIFGDIFEEMQTEAFFFAFFFLNKQIRVLVLNEPTSKIPYFWLTL